MKFFFSFFLLLFVQILWAQEIKLLPSKDALLLGEPMPVKIQTTLAAGGTAGYFYIDSLPHFEVLERSKIDTQETGGALLLTQTITVTSWDSGQWNFPTLITSGVPSKPVPISINYTSPWDPKQPYNDIKGIVPVKNPGRSTWWWYVIGLAVLIALFLLFFPEGKKDKGAVELDKNAYRKAMQQLETLGKEKSADAKSFHTELINIFRTYLKGAKGIQSFSKTTDDLSIQLQSQKLPSAQYNGLVQTLRLSDLVKFAAYKPTDAMNYESLNIIKQSITTIEQGRHAV